MKLSLKSEGERNAFSDKQKLREFVISQPALLAWSIKRHSSERGEMITVRNPGLHIQRKNMNGRKVKSFSFKILNLVVTIQNNRNKVFDA